MDWMPFSQIDDDDDFLDTIADFGTDNNQRDAVLGNEHPFLQDLNYKTNPNPIKPSKKTLKVAVIGPSKSGKSTTICHLLGLLGHVMDKHEKTIETERSQITFIDTPGGQGSAEDVLDAVLESNCALLVVSDCGNGLKETTYEQILAATALIGKKNLVVAVNKCDEDYDGAKFNSITNKIKLALTRAGYCDIALKRVPFVAISGYNGHNLVDGSDCYSWYNGWSVSARDVTKIGTTLIEAIESATSLPRPLRAKNPEDLPLRVKVSDVSRSVTDNNGNDEPVFTARAHVKTGILKTGMAVHIPSCNCSGTVSAMECIGIEINEAAPATYADIHIKLKENEVNNNNSSKTMPWDFIGDACNPLKLAESFEAEIRLLNGYSVPQGSRGTIYTATSKVKCKVDRTTPGPTKGAITVKLSPLKDVYIESPPHFRQLRRLIMYNEQCKSIVAAGMVEQVVHK